MLHLFDSEVVFLVAHHNFSVQVSLEEPIENIMMPLKAAQPLVGTVHLRKVVMRFFRDQVVPIIDEWGSCVGLLHREDCNEVSLTLPLSNIFNAPFPSFSHASWLFITI